MMIIQMHDTSKIKDKNAKMEKLEVNGYFASSNEKFYFLEFENVCNSLGI